LKSTEIYFRPESAPDPARGAHDTPTDPQNVGCGAERLHSTVCQTAVPLLKVVGKPNHFSGNIWHTSDTLNVNYDNKHKHWTWMSGEVIL